MQLITIRASGRMQDTRGTTFTKMRTLSRDVLAMYVVASVRLPTIQELLGVGMKAEGFTTTLLRVP